MRRLFVFGQLSRLMRGVGQMLVAGLVLLAASVPGFADSPPACRDVARDFFGLALGPMTDYPGTLASGLRREGTAFVIRGVGFESLEGSTAGFVFPRIMAFFDRGRFVEVTAIGRLPSTADHGLARLAEAVGEAAGAKPVPGEGSGTLFQCEPGVEVTLTPIGWDDGPAVQLSVVDLAARAAMREYVDQHCADPAKREPGDACR